MQITLDKNILLCGGSGENRLDLLKKIIRSISPNKRLMLIDINKVDLYDFDDFPNLYHNKTYRDTFNAIVIMEELKNKTSTTIVVGELNYLYCYDKVRVKTILKDHIKSNSANFICATYRTDYSILDEQTINYFDYIICFKMADLDDQIRILGRTYPEQKEFECIVLDNKTKEQLWLKL